MHHRSSGDLINPAEASVANLADLDQFPGQEFPFKYMPSEFVPTRNSSLIDVGGQPASSKASPSSSSPSRRSVQLMVAEASSSTPGRTVASEASTKYLHQPPPPPPPPPPPRTGASHPSAELSSATAADAPLTYQQGPLLLFPDTSALITMLGANGPQNRTYFTMATLQALARQNRFGRNLPRVWRKRSMLFSYLYLIASLRLSFL